MSARRSCLSIRKIFTENVYHMGVFSGRYGLGLAKRTKNIPDGTPTFLYTWVEDAILLDHLWTPKADQLPQNRPTPSRCTARSVMLMQNLRVLRFAAETFRVSPALPWPITSFAA